MMRKYFLLSFLLAALLTAAAQKAPVQAVQRKQKADTVPSLKSTRLHEVSISSKKKLPNVQKVSVYAPDDLQIDGSMAEWDNHFKAFNKATGIYYTISNNDGYIYLAVQAKNRRIINKLMGGGLSFTISSSCMDADTNNVTVLFPLMPLPLCREILHTAGKSITESYHGLDEPTYKSNKKSIPQANNDLTENMRYIKVAGVKTITDFVDPNTIITYYKQLPLLYHYFKLIAVNNQSGIKATTRFDKKGAYNYEMAIPIKYLGDNIDKYQKFGYNITLHGRPEDRRPGSITTVINNKIGYNTDVDLPTGFWGEYVLAKSW